MKEPSTAKPMRSDHTTFLAGNERVILDTRYSFVELFRPALIGLGSIVVLIILLTKIGPEGPGKGNLNFVLLLGALSLFFLFYYGLVPAFKKSFLSDEPPRGGYTKEVVALSLTIGFFLLFAILPYHWSGFVTYYSIFVWTAFLVVFVAFFVIPLQKWFFRHFILTSRRLLQRRGMIAKSSIETDLIRIQDVSFEQGFWEKVFGYGNLILGVPEETGFSTVKKIPDPEHVKNILKEQVNRVQGESGYSQPFVADYAADELAGENDGAKEAVETDFVSDLSDDRKLPSDIISQLERLKEMVDKGILTEQEFADAKAKILKKL